MIHQKFKNAFLVYPIDIKLFEVPTWERVSQLIEKQLLMTYVKEKEKLSILENTIRQSIKEGLL